MHALADKFTHYWQPARAANRVHGDKAAIAVGFASYKLAQRHDQIFRAAIISLKSDFSTLTIGNGNRVILTLPMFPPYLKLA